MPQQVNTIAKIMILVITMSAIGCSDSADNSQTNNEDVSREQERIKADKNEQTFIKNVYDDAMKRYSASEPAFMSSFYIGMDRATVGYIAQYLILNDKLHISEDLKNNKSYLKTDYSKFDINDDCYPGCVFFQLEGIKNKIFVNFFWDEVYEQNGLREWYLDLIELESSDISKEDVSFLKKLYSEKYGSPKTITNEDSTLDYVFNTAEHKVDLYYSESERFVRVSYTNLLREQDKIDSEKAREQKIKDAIENTQKKRHQERLNKI